jgi:DNA end-binding protein Ku
MRCTWTHPNYVAPERAGEKPYTLLYEALRRTGQAALAQLTMHNREHLVLLRPGRLGLLLHTLFYRDEIRALEEFRTDTEWVTPQELKLARLLVECWVLTSSRPNIRIPTAKTCGP